MKTTQGTKIGKISIKNKDQRINIAAINMRDIDQTKLKLKKSNILVIPKKMFKAN